MTTSRENWPYGIAVAQTNFITALAIIKSKGRSRASNECR